MIPGLLAQALLGAFLGEESYRRPAYEIGTGPRQRRRGGLFSTEADRFRDFMGSQGVAPPSMGEIDAETAGLMAPSEGPAIIDFPERGAGHTPPPVPPPLPDEATDDWFVEVPEREVAETFAGKALFAMIAAAHADGALSAPERAMIEKRLSSLPEADGAFVRRELETCRPMEAFAVRTDPLDERRTIFALAVAVLKADGNVAPSENRFAGKLAAALGLTKQEAESIIRRVSLHSSIGE